MGRLTRIISGDEFLRGRMGMPKTALLEGILRGYNAMKASGGEAFPELECPAASITERPMMWQYAIEKIWGWYSAKYSDGAVVREKGRSSRSVSLGVVADEKYNFHIPYQKTQFMENLYGNVSVEPEFIQHICLAFRLGVEDCNTLLRTYGHLPLHSKNIHNMAVYTVLSSAHLISGNLLAAVKKLFFGALQVVGDKKKRPVRENKDTKALMDEIISKGVFDSEKFMEYIKAYAPLLNWRHSAIINEHDRLASAMRFVYMPLALKPAKTVGTKEIFDWESPEERYCLFNFLNSFCMELQSNHFVERFIGDIQNDGKKASEGKSGSFVGNRHPTRESMILLWLFEDFFRNSAPVPCPKRAVAVLGKEYFSGEADTEGKVLFDIQKYLFGGIGEEDTETVDITVHGAVTEHYKANVCFNGARTLAVINGNLELLEYSPLNERNAFDRLIRKLLTLKLYKTTGRNRDRYQSSAVGWGFCSDYYCDFCGAEGIRLGAAEESEFHDAVKAHEENGVPLGLGVVFAILEKLRLLEEERYTASSGFARDKENYDKKYEIYLAKKAEYEGKKGKEKRPPKEPDAPRPPYILPCRLNTQI